MPPIPFNHLIDYKLDVLGIALKEFPTSQHHPGCVIQDHADLDTGSIPFMPVYMACGNAMLDNAWLEAMSLLLKCGGLSRSMYGFDPATASDEMLGEKTRGIPMIGIRLD